MLRPGGLYLAQHVGPETLRELYEFFLGTQPARVYPRDPQQERAEAEAAGLRVDTMRMERLQVSFRDVGAVVYFLRKVIWTVPGFSVDGYRDRLSELDALIRREGQFLAHSTRVLVEAHRPR